MELFYWINKYIRRFFIWFVIAIWCYHEDRISLCFILSTGLINDHFEISGRFSKIDSDGYVDRAFTDLRSYFLQGVYKDDNTLIKALTFGNKEQTYQSWFGLTAEQLKEDRRQNPYTYENETDNYWQDHYQLHWNQRIDNNWSTTLGLNYTQGRGYFEQFEDDTDEIDLYNILHHFFGRILKDREIFSTFL